MQCITVSYVASYDTVTAGYFEDRVWIEEVVRRTMLLANVDFAYKMSLLNSFSSMGYVFVRLHVVLAVASCSVYSVRLKRQQTLWRVHGCNGWL